jgi:predicted RNA-binding protein YlqC (UPF0109 family)
MNIDLFSEYVVKGICKEPDMVKVKSYDGEDNETIVEILVTSDDIGSVIGKNGVNAKAVRTLIQAYAYLNNLGHVKVNIDSF